MSTSNLQKNKDATRYFSTRQENAVAAALGGRRMPNSGATTFAGGDVIQLEASMLIECKTSMKEQNSFSIKAEWIKKNKEEAFSQRLHNGCIAFNFGPNLPNYYVIDEDTMKFLVEKLAEEYKD